MGPKIFAILITIVLLAAGIYIVKSGFFGKLASIKAINFFGSLSSSSSFRINVPEYGYRGGDSIKQRVKPVFGDLPSRTPQQAALSPTEPKINPAEIPAGFTERELSPYFKKVRIGSVSPGSDFFYGQIVLYANLNASDTLNITGWAFQANNGNQYIGKAIGVYDPSGLTAESDLYLQAGDFVNLYTTASAITKNFRLNKCIGYLENYNKFTPPLQVNCPYIPRSEIERFDGDCQTYIQSLGSCRLPDPNPPVRGNEYDCKYYLDHTLNYRGCFEKYRNDPDFLSREWRVWLGNNFFDSLHDKIMLLDGKGLLVDAYSY